MFGSYCLKWCLISLALQIVFIQHLLAYQFKNQLEDQSPRIYHHWNTKQKKITGYTTVAYLSDDTTGELVEFSNNLDDKQITFSEKKLWFSSQGELIKYEERDFRTDIKTVNRYTKHEIQTELWEKEQKTALRIAYQSDLVPMEILSLFLQSKLMELEQAKSLTFTLYLPVLALELSKKGLPLSLSRLEMKAVGSEAVIANYPQTVTIRVEPTSLLVQALLPAEKSKFYFTYLKEHPFTLVQFEEGDTQTRLTKPD